MTYFSTSKNKLMQIRDMHMMHIENVLLKDLKEDHLGQREQAALLDEYIIKTRVERSRLHQLLKHSAGLNRLLLDLVATPSTQPVTRRSAMPVKLVTHGILALYRQVALSFIRQFGRISADQLRSELQESGHDVNGQILTHVFRDPRFEQVGYRRSTWAGAKGRFVNNWTAA